jgi:hypothetical protein
VGDALILDVCVIEDSADQARPSSWGWQLGGPRSPSIQKKLGSRKLLPWWPGIKAWLVSLCVWRAHILVEADQTLEAHF